MDAVVAIRDARKVFAGDIASREVHDAPAAGQQADMVFARYHTEIVRLHITDVVARKGLLADGFPVVANGIPDAPATVFVDDRVHCANGAATRSAIQDR